MLTRRVVVGLLGMFPAIAAPVRAEVDPEYPVRAEDGAQVQNFRIPSELDPAHLPGVVWKGARTGDVLLYEFFDYNCAYCRRAARDIDEISTSDPELRLGLVNNPILSLGSVQAAKVQQAILRLYGPDAAYDFHNRMFVKRGLSDGVSALAIARQMGLDTVQVGESADSAIVAEVLSRQARHAASLGMSTTPSFIVAGVGLLGWPGKKALQSIVSNARRCDRPVCDENR